MIQVPDSSFEQTLENRRLKRLFLSVLQRDQIPALTLTDPWGTLVAMGAKRYETRLWNTHYRGPLAIHVSGTLTGEGRWKCDELSVAEVLEAAGCTYDLRRRIPWELPLRKVVAIAWLEEIHDILHGFQVDARERSFGNYGFGRFAWEFSAVYRLQQPLVARGNRLIWKWTPPESFWNEIQGQLDALRGGQLG
jgi:hypothetical protein